MAHEPKGFDLKIGSLQISANSSMDTSLKGPGRHRSSHILSEMEGLTLVAEACVDRVKILSQV